MSSRVAAPRSTALRLVNVAPVHTGGVPTTSVLPSYSTRTIHLLASSLQLTTLPYHATEAASTRKRKPTEESEKVVQ
jgi:hypothetical protein